MPVTSVCCTVDRRQEDKLIRHAPERGHTQLVTARFVAVLFIDAHRVERASSDTTSLSVTICATNCIRNYVGRTMAFGAKGQKRLNLWSLNFVSLPSLRHMGGRLIWVWSERTKVRHTARKCLSAYACL